MFKNLFVLLLALVVLVSNAAVAETDGLVENADTSILNKLKLHHLARRRRKQLQIQRRARRRARVMETYESRGLQATMAPNSAPTSGPSSMPTSGPTSMPTSGPTSMPTGMPTSGPTGMPTSAPTSAPTKRKRETIFSDGFNRDRNRYRLRRVQFNNTFGFTDRETSLEFTSSRRRFAFARQRRSINVRTCDRVRVRFWVLFENFADGERVIVDVNTGSGFNTWKRIIKGRSIFQDNGEWYLFNKAFTLEPGTRRFRIRIRGRARNTNPKFFIDSLRFIGLSV